MTYTAFLLSLLLSGCELGVDVVLLRCGVTFVRGGVEEDEGWAVRGAVTARRECFGRKHAVVWGELGGSACACSSASRSDAARKRCRSLVAINLNGPSPAGPVRGGRDRAGGGAFSFYGR